MLGFLRGIVIEKSPPELLLDVNGVGYEITLPLHYFTEIIDTTETLSLYVHTLVREDVLQLYGFLDLETRALFRVLIKLNGIGAKMAIAILASMNVNDFRLCIERQDVTTLTKLPGVGKKTAERLIIEMQDKLKTINWKTSVGGVNQSSTHAHGTHLNDTVSQAIAALGSLGYKASEAQKIIETLPDKSKALPDLLKDALQKIR